MTVYDIVKKLVGSIEPIGETQTDNVRFENLEYMTTLIELLLTDIDDVAFYFRDRDIELWYQGYRHEDSLLKASKFASKFLDQIGLRSKEGIGEELAGQNGSVTS